MHRLVLPLMLWSGTAIAEVPLRLPDGGDGFDGAIFADAMTPELEARLLADQERNIAALRERGLLQGRAPTITGLIWPLTPSPGIGERFELRAEVMRLGSRVASTRMEFLGADGKLLSTGSGAYIVS